jgi:hypothetical protein
MANAKGRGAIGFEDQSGAKSPVMPRSCNTAAIRFEASESSAYVHLPVSSMAAKDCGCDAAQASTTLCKEAPLRDSQVIVAHLQI